MLNYMMCNEGAVIMTTKTEKQKMLDGELYMASIFNCLRTESMPGK